MKYRDGFLIQVILYTLLWLVSEYVGLLVCIVMASIFGAIWLFSIIVEKIEKSKVPQSFFGWMFLSIWPPLIVALAFTIYYKGNFDWLNQVG